ncbi:hypothetical protein BDW22DRAFT_1402300 [Trametopsis cervina]|nr:hypothetical protein BDW22DRAFT_1402300 [Trametopsis cervina]
MHLCNYCDETEATRKCSGCMKLWYCSKECQVDHWPSHIFNCDPRRPINTAYHLTRAVYDDLLPTDTLTLQEWGLAKAALVSDRGCFMLFGLYAGLIKSGSVKPQQLHKWRIQGTLIQEIKASYEAMPVNSRGEYYPWFLEHQFILEDPTPTIDESQRHADAMVRRAWTSIGKSANASMEDIRKFMETMPSAQRACFVFYGMILESSHPGPDSDIWIRLAFCTCSSQYGEMRLSEAYRKLMNTCTFEMFCESYAQGDLFSMLNKYTPSSNTFDDPNDDFLSREFLADVLGGMPHRNKSVWDLKQHIFSGNPDLPILPVTADYGFMNCKNAEETQKLLEAYKRFFDLRHANTLNLHRACVEGRLHSFLRNDMQLKLKPKKLFARLLRNSYPLSQDSAPSWVGLHLH